MILPILPKLKEGEKWDFPTLAENQAQTEEFWAWWWTEKAQAGVISRPEVIEDGDAILTETVNKATVDVGCCPEFFDRTLANAIIQGLLPARDGLPREHYRNLLLRMVAGGSPRTTGRAQIVFAGGGYGSGKTTVLNSLTQAGQLPRHHVGVDVFKPLIPEYNLIKAVADGRASLTVQKECQELASALFEQLVEEGRSFIWDSSMSNQQATEVRIQQARERGYELTMIAVLTPLEVATRQAMHRARLSRRFPHPDFLPKSHVGFRQAFSAYVPLFDEVTVVANLGDGDDAACVVAEKSGTNELVMLDEDRFTRALSVPMG